MVVGIGEGKGRPDVDVWVEGKVRGRGLKDDWCFGSRLVAGKEGWFSARVYGLNLEGKVCLGP